MWFVVCLYFTVLLNQLAITELVAEGICVCVYLWVFFIFLNLIFIGGLLFFYNFAKMRAGGLARICPNSGWVEKSQPELIRVGSGPARFQNGSVKRAGPFSRLYIQLPISYP